VEIHPEESPGGLCDEGTVREKGLHYNGSSRLLESPVKMRSSLTARHVTEACIKFYAQSGLSFQQLADDSARRLDATRVAAGP
jgi:hypothetical protein